MSGKAVLILGAGFVTKPIIHYLSEKGHTVYVGSRTVSRAEGLCKGAANATAIKLDIETTEGEATLDEYSQKVDAIVSLLPYLFHCKAAAYALKYEKHFLTSSYVSEDMKKLNDEAVAKNLVFINECGVDPGTDHMSAMRVVDGIRARGGKITSFTSYCGGLPAPEDNNNPLGYKFSWAPRGVLLASKNTADFLRDGKECTVVGLDLFDTYELVTIGDYTYECYPNRNSRIYLPIYGMDQAQTIIRGTFRNKGWCPQVKKLVECGYLSLDECDLTETTYLQLLAKLVKSEGKDEASVKADVIKHLKVEADNQIISTMVWLDLFSDKKIGSPKTALDALCQTMMEKMPYKEGERDAIVMQHKFEAVFAADGKKESHTSTMIFEGDKEGNTAMSQTVSLPLAMAANMVLNGTYTKPGLSIPINKELYEPILNELATLGVVWNETSEAL